MVGGNTPRSLDTRRTTRRSALRPRRTGVGAGSGAGDAVDRSLSASSADRRGVSLPWRLISRPHRVLRGALRLRIRRPRLHRLRSIRDGAPAGARDRQAVCLGEEAEDLGHAPHRCLGRGGRAAHPDTGADAGQHARRRGGNDPRRFLLQAPGHDPGRRGVQPLHPELPPIAPARARLGAASSTRTSPPSRDRRTTPPASSKRGSSCDS